jgi:hypothetical protein
VSQPHFWKSVKMTLTLPKWGLGSPSGLPKFQSSIARVKTPCIRVIFLSLKSYESLDVENELAWAIWTSTTQVMCKRRAGSQKGLAKSYDLVKSRESKPGQFRDSTLGVPGQKAIRMWVRRSNAENTIWGKVVGSPESGLW